MADEIHIVFAADDRYAQHAAVAMASILLHAAEPARFHFFVLDDGVTAEKKEKMEKTVAALGGKGLTFLAIKGEAFDDFHVSAQLSRTAYVRLAAADLLPDIVERVLYLDCDLLFFDDAARLYQMDMAGQPVAAVPDCGIMTSARRRREKAACIGLSAGALYFNSGVLLLDLGAWRREDYTRHLLTLAKEKAYPHHDQDVLNDFFRDNWQPLPLRWNVIPPVWFMFLKVAVSPWRYEAAAARENPGILHYAGSYKPWEYPCYPAFNGAYYDTLAKTAFADAPMPQFDPRKKHRSIRRQLLRLHIGAFWGTLLGRRH